MLGTVLGLHAVVLLVRASATRRHWRLPEAHGAERFLGVPLQPGSEDTRHALLRGYRRRLFLAYVPDLVVVPWLLATGRERFLPGYGLFAIVATVVFHVFTTLAFVARARRLQAPPPPGSRRVQLSLAPRRLRDETRWPLEVLIALLVAGAVLALFRTGEREPAIPPSAAVLLLYGQLGLLLLKRLFVGLPVRVPLEDGEEYLRWRTAWLRYHLSVFDGVRLVWGALLLQFLLVEHVPQTWLLGAWVPVLGLLAVTLGAERRRLRVVEHEVRPVRFVSQLPPAPVADLRFFGGGRFAFDSGHPGLLARSPRGLALNLGHSSFYLWTLYLLGFAVLLAWQAL